MASLSDLAMPLASADDLTPLLERIGDARYVLLGEASHGTSEYYAWRARLSRRLIEELGFDFVAVEGDRPDCYQVNRYVRDFPGAGASAREVLTAFQRWPTWMWANTEVVDFVEWLRSHNLEQPAGQRAGFYGFDVYSLWESLRAVLDYLAEHRPAAMEAARTAFRCFEPYREDPQAYAWATRMVPDDCQAEVVALLRRLREEAAAGDDSEADFVAAQNAEVAAGAERYYRAMVRGGPESWNVRDIHMVDTLDRLVAHHGAGSRGAGAKAIVWAHNTHVGDARATDMAADGLVNVGQLVRERSGDRGVVVVGFGGYGGSVVAGDSWGAPMERMEVPPAREGNVERLLHDEVGRDVLLLFPARPDQPRPLRTTLPHQAIGVVYRPGAERRGNYVPTVLGDRYDAFCSFERTTALQPLHAEWAGEPEEPETFPSGV